MTILEKLQARHFIRTVEINPSSSNDTLESLAEVCTLPKEIDAIDITNCAFSKVRISPIALGHQIQESTHKEVIINYTCRDRNIIATESDLLGALTLGIHNVLCMTGDDPSIGDHPEASGVFDLDTCSLIRTCKQLRADGASFTVGAAATAETDSTALQKLQAKAQAGADFFMTQPVYTVADVERVAELQKQAERPFILGVLPLKSAAMAKRLASVPGISIPDDLLERLQDYKKDEFGMQSVELLLPIVKRAKELLSGLHIMSIGESWKIKPLLKPTL